MTWLQTASGRAFDLVAPRAEDVDFTGDIATALGNLPRFTGHAGSYSVAQHCVVGADAIFAETHRPELAAAFLLHDAHEAVVGDTATPIAEAMAEIACEIAGQAGAMLILEVIKELKRRQDTAIFAAAQFAPAWTASVQQAVKIMDLRILITERNHLLGRPPKPWHASIEAAEPIRIKGALKPWPAAKAASEWIARLARYCPAALDRAA